jgi:hypothetical protein
MAERDGIKKIEISGKHFKARAALFALALIVAIAAFVNGFMSMGNTEPGYYELQAAPDKDAPLYASGFRYSCLFEGKPAEIKAAVREADAAYSAALSRAYKLTNPASEYDGYAGIGTLNARLWGAYDAADTEGLTGYSPASAPAEAEPGEGYAGGAEAAQGVSSAEAAQAGAVSAPSEPAYLSSGRIEISRELYEVLKTALEYGESGAGWSPFAGPLNAEWSALLWAEDPQICDPANDANEAERLEWLSMICSRRDGFRLELSEDGGASGSGIPEAQASGSGAQGADRETACYAELFADINLLAPLDRLGRTPVLDLGYLREAFMCEMLLGSLSGGDLRTWESPMNSGMLSFRDTLEIDLDKLRIDAAFDLRESEQGQSYVAASAQSGDELLRSAFVRTETGLPGGYNAEGGVWLTKTMYINLETHDAARMALQCYAIGAARDEAETAEAERLFRGQYAGSGGSRAESFK